MKGDKRRKSEMIDDNEYADDMNEHKAVNGNHHAHALLTVASLTDIMLLLAIITHMHYLRSLRSPE